MTRIKTNWIWCMVSDDMEVELMTKPIRFGVIGAAILLVAPVWAQDAAKTSPAAGAARLAATLAAAFGHAPLPGGAAAAAALLGRLLELRTAWTTANLSEQVYGPLVGPSRRYEKSNHFRAFRSRKDDG